MRTEDIINYVRQLKQYYKTSNPFVLAEIMGIRVLDRRANPKVFKADTLKLENYPTIISLNDALDDRTRYVLCAHELGHALLHEGINHFDINTKNMCGPVEYEANLFAVSLLFEENDFNMPIRNMNNTILLCILRENIRE